MLSLAVFKLCLLLPCTYHVFIFCQFQNVFYLYFTRLFMIHILKIQEALQFFFKNDFELEEHNTFKDNNGNLLILDIDIDKRRLTFVNLYGPNKDDPSFYENLLNRVIRFGNNNVIMVGDRNLLLNPDVDGKNYKHVNYPNSRQKVLKLMSDLNLYDVWREENGDSCKTIIMKI